MYNNYFVGLIIQTYPSELQWNKANSSETEGTFLDLHFSILDRFISCKIYDKRDDSDSEILNFPYLDGGCSSSSSLRYLYIATNSVR